ncbi:MAG: hypothetical protein ABI867_01550 [Kofleriaceae bacterium]
MTRKREPPDEAPEPERKERVIHTRVPESLEAQLRQRAEDLGISVSNLVRNVLGHAFGLAAGVVADSHAVARAVTRKAPAAPAPASLDDVLGWQPIVLGKNAVCARCNALLPRGSDAATGVVDTGTTRFVICQACVAELRA